jgi:hypothetical protein
LTKEFEQRVHLRFEQALEDCSNLVKKSTERMSLQIRAKDLMIKEKTLDIENMRIT